MERQLFLDLSRVDGHFFWNYLTQIADHGLSCGSVIGLERLSSPDLMRLMSGDDLVRIGRVHQELRDGQPVICTKMNTLDPVIMDVIGLLGFDCVWMCAEHGAVDFDRLGHLIRTASINGMDSMVRVAKGSCSNSIRPLELGATGLMVPHCSGEVQTRQIVQQTRFHPIGKRPFDGWNRDGHYTLFPARDDKKQANENTFGFVQIEDLEALDRIEKIASVHGIDGLFVGRKIFHRL